MRNPDLNVDLTYLETIASGDREFIVEMIDMFMTQTPLYLDELKAEIMEENWTGVGSVAHKIKPTLAFIGVPSIMEMIARIEANAKKSENIEMIRADYAEIIQCLPVLFDNLKEAKANLLN